MNKTFLATLGLAVIVTGSVLMTSGVFAQSGDTGRTGLIERIASHFNLNQDEVQGVFDAYRQERQSMMQENRQQANEERLSQLVADGKITEAQKQLILTKQTELQAERQRDAGSFENMTQEERRTEMETRRTEMETWASENGIDVQYVLPAYGHGHGMMGMMHGGRGGWDNDDEGQ